MVSQKLYITTLAYYMMHYFIADDILFMNVIEAFMLPQLVCVKATRNIHVAYYLKPMIT